MDGLGREGAMGEVLGRVNEWLGRAMVRVPGRAAGRVLGSAVDERGA